MCKAYAGYFFLLWIHLSAKINRSTWQKYRLLSHSELEKGAENIRKNENKEPDVESIFGDNSDEIQLHSFSYKNELSIYEKEWKSVRNQLEMFVVYWLQIGIVGQQKNQSSQGRIRKSNTVLPLPGSKGEPRTVPPAEQFLNLLW